MGSFWARTSLIRYKSKGNNPFKLCYFLNLSYTNNIGNKPCGNLCVVRGWWKWADRPCNIFCVAIVLFQAVVGFYKHVFRRFSFPQQVKGGSLNISRSICIFPCWLWVEVSCHVLCFLTSFLCFFSVFIFNFWECSDRFFSTVCFG